MVAAASGYNGQIYWDATKPDGTPKKQLDVSRMQSLGWTARIPLKASLLRWLWFKLKFFVANNSIRYVSDAKLAYRNLITGGAGFLGFTFDRLMDAGEEVICLDNYFTGRKENISQWIGHPRFELVRHDVTEPIKQRWT